MPARNPNDFELLTTHSSTRYSPVLLDLGDLDVTSCVTLDTKPLPLFCGCKSRYPKAIKYSDEFMSSTFVTYVSV